MAARNETDDWQEWYRKWGSRFYLFACQQAGRRDLAEDILQDAIVAVWSKREKLPRLEPGLVFLQIRRCAIDRVRKERRRKAREETFERDFGCNFKPGPNGSTGEIQDALAQLPHEQQEVVVLKIWCGQTFAQIGRALGISANTAASRYRYGIQHLRKQIKEEAR
jgi:RNA polymerase sigma-70 factor (ECF subfamily)